MSRRARWSARQSAVLACDVPLEKRSSEPISGSEGRSASRGTSWQAVAEELAIAVARLWPGLAFGSVSLVADGVRSVGLLVASLAGLWGERAGSRPSDDAHPFGHGRISNVGVLVVAVVVIFAALQVAKAAGARVLVPVPAAVPTVVVALAAAALVVEVIHGRRHRHRAPWRDPVVRRGGIVASGLVVVVSVLGGRIGPAWLDGALALAVAGLVAWGGLRLARGAIDPLLGEPPAPELVRRIRRIALAVSGVRGVHDVVVHRYGALAVVSLHVEVHGRLPVGRGHQIAEEVERCLQVELDCRATVHVDPVDESHPLHGPLRALLDEQLARRGRGAAVGHLRVVGREDFCLVLFDLQPRHADGPALAATLRRVVLRRFPQVADVLVELRPPHVY
jgi:cation diffusion facilitator family transporter